MNSGAINPPSGSGHGFQLVDRLLRPVETVAAVVGGVAMISAMALSAADALLRYFFASPIDFAPRLVESYLMVIMFSMPLAWAFRTGGYVRIVGAIRLLPARVGHLILRLGLFASGIFVALLAWTGGHRFLASWLSDEVYIASIDWPVSWSRIWVPLGLGLLAARLMLMVFGPARDLTVGDTESTEE